MALSQGRTLGVITGCLVLSLAAFAATKSDDVVYVKRPTNQAPDTYSEAGGEATEADTAEEGDEATTGSWADEGGITPTADHADEGGETPYSDGGETATSSPTGGTALVADYVDTVSECAGGPLMSGACGDLRYDGRLGLGIDGQDALEVVGDVRLGGLVMNSMGRLGIGGQPDTDTEENDGALLYVHGAVRADHFTQTQYYYPPDNRTTRIEAAGCRAWAPAMTDDTFSIDAEGRLHSDDPNARVMCRIPVPVGAQVTAFGCSMTNLDGSWWTRAWDQWGVRVLVGVPTRMYSFGQEIKPGHVHFLRFRGFGPDSSFGGCTFRWTRSRRRDS